MANLGTITELIPSGDYTPEGVSFSPTIRHALEGVPFYYTCDIDWVRRRRFITEGDEWNVYTPIKKRVAIVPETIDDYERTREKRVLGKVRVKRIGKIRVKVSNNKWEYKWLKEIR